MPSEPVDLETPSELVDLEMPPEPVDLEMPPEPVHQEMTSELVDLEMPPEPVDLEMPPEPVDLEMPSEPVLGLTPSVYHSLRLPPALNEMLNWVNVFNLPVMRYMSIGCLLYNTSQAGATVAGNFYLSFTMYCLLPIIVVAAFYLVYRAPQAAFARKRRRILQERDATCASRIGGGSLRGLGGTSKGPRQNPPPIMVMSPLCEGSGGRSGRLPKDAGRGDSAAEDVMEAAESESVIWVENSGIRCVSMEDLIPPLRSAEEEEEVEEAKEAVDEASGEPDEEDLDTDRSVGINKGTPEGRMEDAGAAEEAERGSAWGASDRKSSGGWEDVRGWPSVEAAGNGPAAPSAPELHRGAASHGRDANEPTSHHCDEEGIKEKAAQEQGDEGDEDFEAKLSKLCDAQVMYRALCFKVAAFIITFMHPSISAEIIELFNCRQVYHDAEDMTIQYWLVTDSTVECFTRQWYIYMAVAALLILCFVFGWPLAIGLILRFYHRTILVEPKHGIGAYQPEVEGQPRLLKEGQTPPAFAWFTRTLVSKLPEELRNPEEEGEDDDEDAPTRYYARRSRDSPYVEVCVVHKLVYGDGGQMSHAHFSKLDTEMVELYLGPFYRGYEDACYWWQTSLLIVVNIVAAEYQVAIGLLFSVVALAIHTSFGPYVDDADDTAMLMVLSNQFCLSFVLVLEPVASPEAYAVFGVLSLTSSVCVALAIGGMAGSSILDSAKTLIELKNQMNQWFLRKIPRHFDRV
eukprot:gene10106-11963_t